MYLVPSASFEAMLAPHPASALPLLHLPRAVVSPRRFSSKYSRVMPAHPLIWLFLPTVLPLGGAGLRSFCPAPPSARSAPRHHAPHRLSVAGARQSAFPWMLEEPEHFRTHAVCPRGRHRFPELRPVESPPQTEAK